MEELLTSQAMVSFFIDSENPKLHSSNFIEDLIFKEYIVRDEIKNRNLEERQQLRVNLETKINETFDQFKQTMKNYSELNEDRERQFSELKEKDEKSYIRIFSYIINPHNFCHLGFWPF